MSFDSKRNGRVKREFRDWWTRAEPVMIGGLFSAFCAGWKAHRHYARGGARTKSKPPK